MSEIQEWKPPKGEPGPIYNFRRGYKVAVAGRHESSDQYTAFQTYLKLSGNRSLMDLSGLTGHTVQTLTGWRKKYNWELRAARWDQDQLAVVWADADKLRRNAHKLAIVEFRESTERQARLMSNVSEKLVHLLNARLEKMIEAEEEIPLSMISNLIRAAASLSEQSRQSWGNALGVNELLQVVESEVEKVRVEELSSVDPYQIPVEE